MNTTPVTRITTHSKPITSDQFPACPVCKNKDKVEKASGIYARGTRIEKTVHSRGVTVAQKGTALALKLRPPPKPKRSELFSLLLSVSIVASVVWTGFILYQVPPDTRKELIPYFLACVKSQSICTSEVYEGIIKFIKILSIWLLPPAFLFLSFLGRIAHRSKLASHQLELEFWQKQFYCHRCDSVFTG